MNEGQSASGPQAAPADLSSDRVRKLEDELTEARADRALAEAEVQSLVEHHGELRAELLRQQAVIQAAALDTVASRQGEAHDQRVQSHHDPLEVQRLQAELADLRQSLVEAQTQTEALLQQRDAMLSSRSWKMTSLVRRLSGGLRPA